MPGTRLTIIAYVSCKWIMSVLINHNLQRRFRLGGSPARRPFSSIELHIPHMKLKKFPRLRDMFTKIASLEKLQRY